jgi:hypothetical protein
MTRHAPLSSVQISCVEQHRYKRRDRKSPIRISMATQNLVICPDPTQCFIFILNEVPGRDASKQIRGQKVNIR